MDPVSTFWKTLSQNVFLEVLVAKLYRFEVSVPQLTKETLVSENQSTVGKNKYLLGVFYDNIHIIRNADGRSFSVSLTETFTFY